jgi:hypothetical protein
VNLATARAVFHGVRSDQARKYISRLFEAINAEQSTIDDFQFVFTQLGHITDARNSILHYGSMPVDGPNFLSTNSLFALTEDRLRTFPVSREILNQMTGDLGTITTFMRNYLLRTASREFLADAARAQISNSQAVRATAWQYKPPSQKARSDKNA